jgi:hypothetical protein
LALSSSARAQERATDAPGGAVSIPSGRQQQDNGVMGQTVPAVGTTGLGVVANVTGVSAGGRAVSANGQGASAANAQAVSAQGERGAAAAGAQGMSASSAQALDSTSRAVAADGRSAQSQQARAAGAASAQAQGSAARPQPAGSAPLEGAVKDIRAGQELEAKGGDDAVAPALKKLFDAARTGGVLAAGQAAGPVSGKTERAIERVMQTAKIADQASHQDAPDLYRAAIDAAKEAASAKALSPETAESVSQTIIGSARARAEKALPALANAAYAAATTGAESALKAAKKGLDRWEALLGSKDAPLIVNGDKLKADFQRVAEAPHEKGAVPITIRFEKRGSAYFAPLPTGSVARLSDKQAASFALSSDPTAALTAGSIDAALLEHSASGGGASELFSVSRRAAGRAVVPAVVDAAVWTLRSLLSSVWHWLKAAFAKLLGRAAPELALSRAPDAQEAKAAKEAGAQVSFVDYSAVERPALALAVDWSVQVEPKLEQAYKLADVNARLSGDSSGRAELDAIAARLRAETKPSETDWTLFRYWAGRLRDDSLARLRRPLEAEARRRGSAISADLSDRTGVVQLASSVKLDLAGLLRAGFQLETRDGLTFASFGPGFSREELGAALHRAAAAAKGEAVAAAAPAEAARLAQALEFARAHPRQAEAEAAIIQAELSASAATLEPVGRVPSFEGGSVVVSRAVRAGRRSPDELYIVSQPSTGRVFGFRAARPAPAPR